MEVHVTPLRSSVYLYSLLLRIRIRIRIGGLMSDLSVGEYVETSGVFTFGVGFRGGIGVENNVIRLSLWRTAEPLV